MHAAYCTVNIVASKCLHQCAYCPQLASCSKMAMNAELGGCQCVNKSSLSHDSSSFIHLSGSDMSVCTYVLNRRAEAPQLAVTAKAVCINNDNNQKVYLASRHQVRAIDSVCIAHSNVTDVSQNPKLNIKKHQAN